MTDPGAASGDGQGQQNERTSLAWVRTGLSIMAVGALLTRQAASTAVAATVFAATAVVALALILGADRVRRRRTESLGRGDSILGPGPIAATAVATAALAVVAALFVALQG